MINIRGERVETDEKRQRIRITGGDAADIRFKAVYASVRFVGKFRIIVTDFPISNTPSKPA